MKNAEFYARQPLDKPVNKDRRGRRAIKWKQILAIAALFVFFAPFIPNRRRPFHSDFPTDWFDYLEKAGFASLFAFVVLFIIFVADRTKYTSASYHYKFAGTFVVTDKIAKPKKRISLQPGSSHFVSVDSKLFHALQTGDKVYVERSLTGEIISIRRV